MGLKLGLKILTDSSTAKGICARKGVGKLRHVEVCQMWVQQEVSAGRIQIVKVKGKNNPADILTKHIDNETLTRHINYSKLDRRDDRHEMAPQVAQDDMGTGE